MAKVLIVTTSSKTRGGISSVVKAHRTGPQWKAYNCEWIETHIDRSAAMKIFYFLRGLMKFLFKIPSADLVHIHLAAVERKMPFVFLTKLFGKKLVIHLHFGDPKTTIYHPVKSKRYRWCLSKADRVIVLSESWKNLIAREWHIDTEVIPNPCPDIDPTADYRIDSPSPYILFAANINPMKGYRELIAAFAAASRLMPGWRLVMAGNGEVGEARRLASEAGIADKVEFPGWIAGEKKDEAFRNAACYCLPSYFEGFPMGILDAWAYHLPVITTPVGGIPDVVRNGENGMVVAVGDVESLTESLLALRDRDVRARLSAGAARMASEVFGLSKINARIGQIYSELLNENS